MSEIINREFRLYICFFVAFFLFCLFISKPSANKKLRIYLSYTCFFAATLFCFPFSFAMRPSFTVVIRQCSANCMQKQYTALPREDDDNDGATEEQRSRWNLGKVNKEE